MVAAPGGGDGDDGGDGGAAAPRRPAATPPAHSWRLAHATTVAAFHVGNVFQGRAGSPEEDVFGQALRQDLRLSRPGSKASVTLRAEITRLGSLGVVPSATARASWSLRASEAWLDVGARWNRPAFRAPDGAVADADSATVGMGFRRDLPAGMEAGAWVRLSREHVEIDARRDGHSVLGGASLRLLRSHAAFSPELGLELERRSAGAAAFSYEQRRFFLRLRSRPIRRVSVSLLMRLGLRDYEQSEGAAPDADREDRRRTLRLTCDVRLRDALEVVTYASWDDGESSLDARAFESVTAWAGLRFSR